MSVQWDCLSYLKTLIDQIDWVITASTNTLYFKYDGGAATEVTVTAGTYTTTALETALVTAIKAALSIGDCDVSYINGLFNIQVAESHEIQFVNENSTMGSIIGFTEDSNSSLSISSDTYVYTRIQYVDYFTEANVNKIGKRFPSVLIEDSDEEWEESGGFKYDVFHNVNLYLYDNINQDRLELLLENQKALTDAIKDDASLGGNAICATVISIEKGQYYNGEINWRDVGYNDNISIRRIVLRIREEIS